MATLRFRVPGMSCRHCVRTVTAAVRDLPGVVTLEASAATTTLTVTGWVSTQEVLEALAGCGYPEAEAV